jgi:hypothetical protein
MGLTQRCPGRSPFHLRSQEWFARHSFPGGCPGSESKSSREAEEPQRRQGWENRMHRQGAGHALVQAARSTIIDLFDARTFQPGSMQSVPAFDSRAR